MVVLSDTKHHVVIGEETFPAAFRNQRLWYSGKVSSPIVWLSATFDCHAFLHEKGLGVKVMPECKKKTRISLKTPEIEKRLVVSGNPEYY